MKILADAALPNLPHYFLPPFSLTLYHHQNEVANLLPGHDILLCRSTLKVNEKLLLGSQIQCVATASSGTDHVDSKYLSEQGILLFDAKGCNAKAVADYVVATLACLFKDNRVKGNKAGIIGVGEVGSQVEKRLQALGFDIICYDPFKEIACPKHHHYTTLETLTKCDLLCIHANLHDTLPYPSANLLAEDFLSALKSKAVIINAARGGIINEQALLQHKHAFTYCTDVYIGEPDINVEIVNLATLCTPHIAGHSIEAKNAAIAIVSKKLYQYYLLPFPPIRLPLPAKEATLLSGNHWEDIVLSLYNPYEDTQDLKNAADKSLAFLRQRKAHNNRHDFSVYNASGLDDKIKLLLGQER